jgi:hypothetical protein
MRLGIRRSAIFLVAASMIATTLPSLAQSGRSWMNGIVFGVSETEGLPGAAVELVGDRETARLRTVALRTVTGPDGKYAFDAVPYGPYTFRVSAEGFAPYEISLYVASDALTALHVRLKPIHAD